MGEYISPGRSVDIQSTRQNLLTDANDGSLINGLQGFTKSVMELSRSAGEIINYGALSDGDN